MSAPWRNLEVRVVLCLHFLLVAYDRITADILDSKGISSRRFLDDLALARS